MSPRLLILAALAAPAFAADPPADPLGDPLPPGAAARLGGVRWRHEGEAKAMAFSPDGNTLAVLSENEGTLSFFETATGKVAHRLRGPAGRYAGFLNVAYSPDGSVVAAQDGQATIRLWDAKTLKPVRTLKGPGTSPHLQFMRISFSPDGKLLAANSGEGAVVVWDVACGDRVRTLTGHKHSNPALLFAPDSATLLVAANPAVRLYAARTGKYLRGIDADAFALAVSADGKVVASGAREGIVLSEFATGKELARLEADRAGILDLAFTPDGQTLVSGGEDGKVRVWDVAAKKPRFVLDGRGWIGRSMVLSPDGKTVALGGVYNVVRLWDVATGKERFEPPDGHDAPVHALAFSPDGRVLASGGANQRILLWDWPAGRVARRLTGSSAWQLAFSPDGRQLASAWEFTPKVRVWDAARAEEVRALTPVGADDVRGTGAAFTPDGRGILAVSWRRTDAAPSVLKVWDAESGKATGTLELAGVRWPTALAVSPDGRSAAVGGMGDRPVRLIDLKRLRERPVRVDEHAVARSAAFSPDGRLLAVGTIDRTVRLVEVETQAEAFRCAGHERSVTAVAFAPGGRMLATAEGGPESVYWKPGRGPQTIRFWDVATGRELARLGGHDSDVNALAFTPDGRRLVSGQKNGILLVWEVPAAARPAAAAGRKLTEAELTALWADLAGADVRRAYDAVWALAASEAGVGFVAKAVRPVEKVDAARVRKWVAALDGDKFADREEASRQLARLGEDVEAELRAALPGRSAEEARQRLLKLVDGLLDAPHPERLRELRAVWTLELSGTPAARRALAALAGGDPGARLTREAKAAVGRLAATR